MHVHLNTSMLSWFEVDIYISLVNLLNSSLFVIICVIFNLSLNSFSSSSLDSIGLCIYVSRVEIS